MFRTFFGLFALLLSVACQVSPSHPSLSENSLPPLMQVRNFVASTSFNDNYRLSPDGTFMVYQGVAKLRSAIFIKDLTGKTATRVMRFKGDAPKPFWAADSKHVLFHMDVDGRENYHVFAVNVDDAAMSRRDLTPFESTKSFVARVPRQDSATIYVMHNNRNKEIFDLYKLDLESGQLRLIFENNGGVENLLLDDLGNVKARVYRDGVERQLQVSSAIDQWSTVLEFGQFDSVHPIDFNESGETLYLSSNHDSDKHQLIELNLATGEQSVLFADDDYDLGWTTLSSKDSRLLFVSVEGEYPRIEFFDGSFEKTLAPFVEYGKHGMNVMSVTRAEDAMTVARYNSRGANFYYYDLTTGESRLLGNGAMHKYSDTLTSQIPIKVKARDGLPLEGYLSLPNGTSENSKLPTVLLVHGGPWARDTWGYDTATQFLTNRGYAVLSINYRGSSGYGKQFMMAATREFAGKMHDDLA
ncbi:MAG: prolyl oligopeptidase family serine peptidase [Granulosicoccaceae bacterium]